MTKLDQIFVSTKHWLVGLAPEMLQSLASILLSIIPIMAVFGGCFAVTTILERKGLGRIQNRFGPNRVGPFGFLQPMADGIKMLTKEDIVPFQSDKVMHFLAPIVLTVPIWLAFSVLPFGRNMVAVDFNAGILFFFAAGAASELAVFMAGWASQNKYSLMGAMRAMAQMISYEVPLVLSAIPVIMIAGSLSLPQIVEAQAGYGAGWFPQWHVFTPWGLAGFGLFLVAATAESNRSPFDLPEGESELIAGFLTEYSGFKYALFFLGEYLGLFAISGLAVTLFLGGWHAPLPILEWLPSWFWFFVKFASLIAAFIWVRGTMPRLRMDQLLNLSWKFLVPLAVLNLFVTAVWHFSSNWQSFGGLAARWLMCGGLLAAAYVLLGRSLSRGQGTPRKYTYAE
ncbi:MAG: NADH-quinone oxidoreductase subunit NuoH [Verrucomicrobia bacterium]|nr:NADH-quinone oxidoreductase subunit NuoH [Verrucomicrobiota bacterium]